MKSIKKAITHRIKTLYYRESMGWLRTLYRRLLTSGVCLFGFSIGFKLAEAAKEDIGLYYRIYGKEAVENRRFYNIGAAGFRLPAWTNVDHESAWFRRSILAIDIDWDLLSLTPIPVEDNSAEVVYSSQTIHFITDEAAQNMFNESHRILKKGGYFRVAVANIDLAYRAYKENDRHYFFGVDTLSKMSIQQRFLGGFASSASTLLVDGEAERISDEEFDRVFRECNYEEALNYCVSKCSLEVRKRHANYHMSWWNKDKLFRMLRIAGFDNIYLSAYGQSLCPVLRNTSLFDNTHPEMSVYVEAVK